MKFNFIVKYSFKKFSSSTFRDFANKKTYKKTIREMDKFNKIPYYSLDKASNLFNDNSGLGEFDRSELEDYKKKSKEEKLDRLDLAKRKLKYEKDNLESQIKTRQLNLSFENSLKNTERLLNKDPTYFKGHEDHPEIESDFKGRDVVEELDNASKDLYKNEYGNYTKYFTVEKIKEPNVKSEHKRKYLTPSYNKKLENIRNKYNKHTSNYKSVVEERDRRFAERINKDLNRDDLKFDYSDFITQSSEDYNRKDTVLEFNYKTTKTNNKESVYDLMKFNDSKGTIEKYIKSVEKKKPNLHETEYNALTIDENGSPVPNRYFELIDKLNELEFDKNKIHYNNTKPTLSMEAREDLYREYLDGFSIQELSLKYGILPKNVKKHICDKYVYWNMIYPKIGPLRHRKLMNEAVNNSKMIYVDYGADLQEMAYREHTVPMTEFRYKKLNPQVLDMVARWYHNEYIKRKKERIPLKYVGHFRDGYLIYDEFVRRGKAGKRPSNVFIKYLNCKDNRPSVLPDKLRNKIPLGPRLASGPYSRLT